MIKTKNLNILKNVDNDALQLFLAKKDNGAWLTATEAAVVCYESVAYHFKTINAEHFLMNPKNFGEEFQLEEGQVHVLVVAPMSGRTLEKPEFVVDGVNIPITDRMTFNSRTLVDFWRTFQEVPTDGKANAVVALPEETFLLGDLSQGSRIFIRPCYLQLWEVTLKMVQDEVKEKPHLVIDGNSGIGKTYFGYMMLLYLARLGKAVVYEGYGTKKCVLFSHNVVVEGSQEDFIPILKLPTTYYVVDGVDPA
ncbi:hypothetical protein P3T76_009068 [Phytophthora citrophthora]|uniref:Crinkler effector protein N-terminal domain-containing protein n=1 Tax=Phytophthora citrophthora TaxID=4793 RepID=A0AAD9LJF1_9STRA|nr:hypothetical protein P3T76_009068 [Phytophthora citrophthora]